MAASEESLALLRSIDLSLKSIVVLMRADAEKRVTQTQGAGAPAVASDADLDGQYGDPVIKAKDPRDWTGPPMTGRRFSQCPADYLEMLAERYEYFASKEEDAKKARYDRLDAARARGWAERIRSGKHSPPDDDDGVLPSL